MDECKGSECPVSEMEATTQNNLQRSSSLLQGRSETSPENGVATLLVLCDNLLCACKGCVGRQGSRYVRNGTVRDALVPRR